MSQYCSLLPELPKSIKFELSHLSYSDQCVIPVQYDRNEAVHILDEAPVFAVVPTNNGGLAYLRNDIEPDLTSSQQWLQSFGSPVQGDMIRLTQSTPMWEPGVYTRYLRVLDFLLAKNIFPFAAGAFVSTSFSTHKRYVKALAENMGNPSTEYHRQLFDPFVKKVPFRHLCIQ